MKYLLLIIATHQFSFAYLRAQNDSIAVEKTAKVRVLGYVKHLSTMSVPSLKGDWSIDNQIHNRLKIKYALNNNVTISVDMRNRLFAGESIEKNPLFVAQTTKISDFIKLGGIVFQEKSVLLHTVFDRANIDFQKKNWQITIGKQRINWSKTYVWNTNDIFNAYSFFDFDYEERQGTDAILVRKYWGMNNSVEFVSNIQCCFDKTIFAILYKFNKKNTDYQILAGKKDSTWTAGFGWAGQIKDAGIKGEVTYFQPQTGGKGTFVGVMSLDYTLPNTLEFKLETILNSNPATATTFAFLTQQVTANSLIHNKFSVFGSARYNITPLSILSINTILNVDDNSFFVNPTINFNLNDNTELLLASQILAGKQGSLFAGIGGFVFTRLKWSF